MLGTSKQKTRAKLSDSGENCWTLVHHQQLWRQRIEFCRSNLRILPFFYQKKKSMIYPQEDSRLASWASEVELGSNFPSNTQ